jgi:FkbM family methyltransferase
VRHGHFARAIAFEPAPDNVRLLEHNVVQNGFEDRIRVMPVALSAEDGRVPFELSATNYGDHRIRLAAEQGAFEESSRTVIHVPVRTLDGALAEAGIRPDQVTLLWVDVQGHEGHLFRGARTLLAAGVPVATEFWPYGIRRSGMTPEEYIAIVTPWFTHYSVIRENGTTTRQTIDRLGDEFARLHKPASMEQLLLVRKPS